MNRILGIEKDNLHIVINILGIRLKFRCFGNMQTRIVNIGKNNHVYVIDENNVKKEILKNPENMHILIEGNNNSIVLKKPFREVANCSISISESNNASIEIGKNAYLVGCNLNIFNGENQKLYIGDNVSLSVDDLFNVHNNSSLYIEDGCMFSQRVTIYTSDGHAIIDKNLNKVINRNVNSCVRIGKHSWVGFGSIILKNSKLPPNSILGAGSLLTKDYSHVEEGTVFAGTSIGGAIPIKNGVS